MKYLILACLLALPACAHKADLKKPSEIAHDQEKAAHKKPSRDVVREEKEEDVQDSLLPLFNLPGFGGSQPQAAQK